MLYVLKVVYRPKMVQESHTTHKRMYSSYTCMFCYKMRALKADIIIDSLNFDNIVC